MTTDGRAAAATASSSVALLQERFRELEKMKERRVEQLLLRALADRRARTPAQHWLSSPWLAGAGAAGDPAADLKKACQPLAAAAADHKKACQPLASAADLKKACQRLGTAAAPPGGDYADVDTSLHL